VAVAAVLLESAFTSAYFNVEINLKYLKDEEFARDVRKELTLKAKKIKKIRLETEVKVGNIIRG
jgi:formiminotetrahydrofolate cyclodeaminase